MSLRILLRVSARQSLKFTSSEFDRYQSLSMEASEQSECDGREDFSSEFPEQTLTPQERSYVNFNAIPSGRVVRSALCLLLMA